MDENRLIGLAFETNDYKVRVKYSLDLFRFYLDKYSHNQDRVTARKIVYLSRNLLISDHIDMIEPEIYYNGLITRMEISIEDLPHLDNEIYDDLKCLLIDYENLGNGIQQKLKKLIRTYIFYQLSRVDQITEIDQMYHFLTKIFFGKQIDKTDSLESNLIDNLEETETVYLFEIDPEAEWEKIIKIRQSGNLDLCLVELEKIIGIILVRPNSQILSSQNSPTNYYEFQRNKVKLLKVVDILGFFEWFGQIEIRPN